jgi:integrase
MDLLQHGRGSDRENTAMATIRKRAWRTASGEARESWIVDFRDQHGKRRHKQFDRKKDADVWLVQARGQVERGTFTADSASISVGEACALWLERCERDGLERSTMTGYRSHVKHHIGPLLGPVKLSRLSRPMVEQFADDMLASGRTRATARKVLGSLVSLIGEAQRRGLVAQNVALGVNVKMAKRHKKRVEIPSKPEMRNLLESAASGREKPLLMLAAFSGLRASELRGLPWSSIDFDDRVIRVRQRADTSGRIGSPKSASSMRDIPMGPELISALKQWRLASGVRDGLVFPGRHGRPLCHNTLRSIAGRLHRLRHWYASWIIDQGFNAKKVQTYMGHASIAQTYNVYGHLLDRDSDHDRLAAAERSLLG